MKTLLLPLVFLLTGCAYLHDRAYDAMDMVTLSAEAIQVGASAQVGPSVFGLSAGKGIGVGVRSGLAGSYEFSEVNLFLIGAKGCGSKGDERDKGYVLSYLHVPFGDEDEQLRYELDGHWQNKWQIEVSLGCLIGIRAGVNIVEIVDFVLGLAAVDICDDDVATIEKREQAEFRASKEGLDNKTLEIDLE